MRTKDSWYITTGFTSLHSTYWHWAVLGNLTRLWRTARHLHLVIPIWWERVPHATRRHTGPHCVTAGLQRAFIVTAKRTSFVFATRSRAMTCCAVLWLQISELQAAVSSQPGCCWKWPRQRPPAACVCVWGGGGVGVLPPADRFVFVSATPFVAAGLWSYGRSHRFPSLGTLRESGQPGSRGISGHLGAACNGPMVARNCGGKWLDRDTEAMSRNGNNGAKRRYPMGRGHSV
jgi:hypothetical protein